MIFQMVENGSGNKMTKKIDTDDWLQNFNESIDKIEWVLCITTFITSVICIFTCPGARIAWTCVALWIARTMIEKKTSAHYQNEVVNQREMYEDILVEEVKKRHDLEEELKKIKTNNNNNKGDANTCRQ